VLITHGVEEGRMCLKVKIRINYFTQSKRDDKKSHIFLQSTVTEQKSL